MARTFDSIDDALRTWLEQQPVFFVATAPSGPDGHVNVSPKGYDSFRVLGPSRVAYLDLTGSGIETVAHVRDNGRVTVMFCAFEGPPRIVRLYGRATLHRPGDPTWDDLAGCFPTSRGQRSIIDIDVHRISSSCGFAVPFLSFDGERSRLADWADHRSPEEIEQYWHDKNQVSIDGLPGLA
jgi:hypothetical protein